MQFPERIITICLSFNEPGKTLALMAGTKKHGDTWYATYLGQDEHGNHLYKEKKTGRTMVWAGTVPRKKDAVEEMLDNAVKDEMRRRHPDTYQDPDDKAGTA